MTHCFARDLLALPRIGTTCGRRYLIRSSRRWVSAVQLAWLLDNGSSELVDHLLTDRE